jgi:hypothetical protein
MTPQEWVHTLSVSTPEECADTCGQILDAIQALKHRLNEVKSLVREQLPQGTSISGRTFTLELRHPEVTFRLAAGLDMSSVRRDLGPVFSNVIEERYALHPDAHIRVFDLSPKQQQVLFSLVESDIHPAQVIIHKRKDL